MLVQDQYHPHCHVAIFSQSLVALRVRSQASDRKVWNFRSRIMSNIVDAATATAHATASVIAGHAADPSGFQHGSAAGIVPPAAAPPAATGAKTRAHDPGARVRARTASPSRGRDGSRSPRGAPPSGGFNMPVPPGSPGTASWHDGMPGPSCSTEDLRWYAICEIGSIKETARANGRNVHNLMKEVDSLKAACRPRRAVWATRLRPTWW